MLIFINLFIFDMHKRTVPGEGGRLGDVSIGLLQGVFIEFTFCG